MNALSVIVPSSVLLGIMEHDFGADRKCKRLIWVDDWPMRAII